MDETIWESYKGRVNNIKIDLTEMGCEDWALELAWDRT